MVLVAFGRQHVIDPSMLHCHCVSKICGLQAMAPNSPCTITPHQTGQKRRNSQGPLFAETSNEFDTTDVTAKEHHNGLRSEMVVQLLAAVKSHTDKKMCPVSAKISTTIVLLVALCACAFHFAAWESKHRRSTSRSLRWNCGSCHQWQKHTPAFSACVPDFLFEFVVQAHTKLAF